MALPPKPQGFSRSQSVTLSGGEYAPAQDLQELSDNFEDLVKRVRALETAAKINSVRGVTGNAASCAAGACETATGFHTAGLAGLAAGQLSKGCVGPACAKAVSRLTAAASTGAPKNSKRKSRKSRKSRKL